MAYPRRFFVCMIEAILGKANMARITISLRDQEKTALRALAEKESRDPRAQAALIICQELERRGLLVSDESTVPEPAPAQKIQ